MIFNFRISELKLDNFEPYILIKIILTKKSVKRIKSAVFLNEVALHVQINYFVLSSSNLKQEIRVKTISEKIDVLL